MNYDVLLLTISFVRNLRGRPTINNNGSFSKKALEPSRTISYNKNEHMYSSDRLRLAQYDINLFVFSWW